ncbi:V-type proton ATPase 116 kDa subunit a1-like [Pollicipes pollicipes]|uniref:V-type proton ATPase 116 kDa subunit a1-like n=1 Tax=Pollicipes pollicipes TaxID=41117 RepID=UPI0018859B88|nr:V-type proton ATPase 116 kDa subunit a1-like [Pollicipes pollicipes]XP_037077351.1 V-type proton ATPase 116 kDa subunit a1-like [Pollicipes pollicipes]
MSSWGLFRSEDMAQCQLFLQTEAAYNCVSELGELGVAQFKDLNPDVNSFQRKYVNEVRRCEEMERKLRYFEKEIQKDGIPVLDTNENPEAPQPREMNDLEQTYEKLEAELKEVNNNAETLKKNYLELTELNYILAKTQMFFDEKEGPQVQEGIQHALVANDEVARTAGSAQLNFVSGVIRRERVHTFELMLWRACRGNVFLRQAEIEKPLEDPISGENVNKNVFIVFFQGEHLRTRVKKICEGFRATVYPCPDTPAERREMKLGVMTRIEDLNTVLAQTQDHHQRVLLAAAKNIRTWFVKVRKIKAIYHTLNLFNLDVTQKCLIGECWVPLADMSNIQMALRRGSERAGSTISPVLNAIETRDPAPTYNRTNKFTNGFQTLVDAYGVANYREMNPAPYTIITFPFLFGVMFGDMGHGLLMALFAGWMVLNEKKLGAKRIENEIASIFFGGRYIILLMGVFSMYTGLIYNDIFSKSLNIFGSSWRSGWNATTIWNASSETSMLVPENSSCFKGQPYPFGFDPIWQLAENKVTFQNAFKMKLSVLLGVVQMVFGVCLSVFNYRHFRQLSDIVTMFLPQILFLLCLFGWLCVICVLKWCLYSATPDPTSEQDIRYGSHCAPSLLLIFINMFLLKDMNADPKGTAPGEQYCDGYLFDGQKELQYGLLALGVLCIPWMLIAKPVLIYMRRRKAPVQLHLPETAGAAAAPADGTSIGESAHGGHEEEEEEFSEVCIHQAIHTVEYVLGSVSHTASYLRLWALSLAHSQLSEVLWTMVLVNGFSITHELWGSAVLFLIFGGWTLLTVSILIVMEGLSAFLHTLRLHWVEFQSKFYKGEGYMFTPFRFKDILQEAESAE